MPVPEFYMQRCLNLAERGRGTVAPNPMVGCVIVHEDQIIGEGWHQKYGEAHAEVHAIRAVEKPELLSKSTLYVNLEPCAHYGKTPPCADLILKHKIPHVVIGCVDSFSEVSGRGIEKLRQGGADVKTGVLEKESRELNKRFFTFHEQKRPYLILKWAETADGFVDRVRKAGSSEKPLQISGSESRKLLHRWRAEECGILIGTHTALLDNPLLTVREITGKDPLRVVFDRENRIPENYHLKSGLVPTLIFTRAKLADKPNLTYVQLPFGNRTETLRLALDELHTRKILSVLVEGGTGLLDSFFQIGLWDEARIFRSPLKIGTGVPAPVKPVMPFHSEPSGEDELRTYRNLRL